MATCFCTGRCRAGLGCAAHPSVRQYPVVPWREPRDYGTRTCPLCVGKGLNPRMPWLVCPKCNGEKKVRA